jgi:hypothetical protein
MANAGVPAGKRSEGKGVRSSGGKVNGEAFSGGVESFDKEESMNQLPSTARVVKAAKSNLMTGMSQTRGPGGNK